jgi:H+/Cl- antiporter ClcA
LPESSRFSLAPYLGPVRHLLRWIPISIAVGILAGSASALLLASLENATRIRESHLWLILLLAPAGFAVGLLYHYLGRSVEAGNNLILDQIHAEIRSPYDVIPLRMTPLILLGTYLTHLFGGSAGREGTAIQTGASLADQLAKPLQLSPRKRRLLLLAGVAGGCASVFGTPLAGAVFGLEVLAIGAVAYDGLAPCFLSAFIADYVTRAWHIHHTIYRVDSIPPTITPTGLLAAIAAGIAFGLTALAFARITHAISALAKRHIAYPPLRPFLGGIIVSVVVFATHTTRYIGLGIPTIVAAFHTPLPTYAFAAKSLLTSITLGAGFKGGEVTPLFFIGATLGNALGHILPLPFSLLAGMGFVAVFAGAANTPIASTLMAVELFGAEAGAYAAIACVVSYLFSGHSGIYRSQRIGRQKYRQANPSDRPGTSDKSAAPQDRSSCPP